MKSKKVTDDNGQQQERMFSPNISSVQCSSSLIFRHIFGPGNGNKSWTNSEHQKLFPMGGTDRPLTGAEHASPRAALAGQESNQKCSVSRYSGECSDCIYWVNRPDTGLSWLLAEFYNQLRCEPRAESWPGQLMWPAQRVTDWADSWAKYQFPPCQYNNYSAWETRAADWEPTVTNTPKVIRKTRVILRK